MFLHRNRNVFLIRRESVVAFRLVHESHEAMVKRRHAFVVEEFKRFEIEIPLGFVDPKAVL